MQTNNKLREALKKILDLTNSLDENCAVDPVEIRDIARAALAEPIRNCEVGTAEEQSVRMAEFCRAQYKKTDGVRLCSGCRFFELAGTECQFAWAQMPYEEGDEK